MESHLLINGRGKIALTSLLFGIAGLAAGIFWGDKLRGFIDGTGGTAKNVTDHAEAIPGQLWTCGMHPQVIQDRPGDCPICHMKLTPLETGVVPAATSGDRKVKYWWDPMLSPPYISDKPGRSPMGMDLIPVYEDEISAGMAITIDPVVVQNMGVRTASVREGPLMQSIRAAGYLAEAQPNIHDVNLRVSGWIERLFADTQGMRITEGEPLFELYSPELQAALGELITVRHLKGSTSSVSAQKNAPESLYESTLRKLELLGLSRAKIEAIAALERVPGTVTFTSPITGDITEKMVVAGAAVKAGDLALRIVDHTTLWIDAQVYERQLSLIQLGQRTVATVEAFPGEEFQGEVIFVHPRLDSMTRTVTVRMAVPNPTLRLRPGMYATVRIESEPIDRALLVPREAIIDSGVRKVAFVAGESGHFEPRSVKTGLSDQEGMVQILEGLAPGEFVVTSGQFLLDSESRMREAIQKYLSQKPMSPAPQLQAEPMQGAHSMPVNQSSPLLDPLISAYLEIASRLGAVQETPTPININAVLTAARGVQNNSQGTDDESVANDIAAAAALLADQPIDRQRELFKPLSAAVVKLLERTVPSPEVGERLFIMHCPMAPGDWVQSTERVANPYYATEMKSCGTLVRTIDIRKDAAR